LGWNQVSPRLPVLDGWRGISILCVLAGHMLPLGPKFLQLNLAIATTGMSLFFILSGFLIVSMLVHNDNVACFLVRRVCRIVPLAWSFLIVVLLFDGASWEAWRANLLFYANLPPFYLNYVNGHFWSLCVEMQFYLAIALAVGVAGRRALVLVPLLCATVTAARVAYGEPISIITWFRVDDILAGGCLALALGLPRIVKAASNLPALAPFLLLPLLLASCHPATGVLNYGRPYFAALLIGSTIVRSQNPLQQLLCGRMLSYLAQISFALYVIHPLTFSGWMGTGDITVRYTKRIGSFLLAFLFAHLSTFYFEKYWIQFGHRLAAQVDKKAASVAVG
jgi:peptidoglycan/LPS O-acetylase OafA/YrhL